jgi:hypothetical protein
VSVDEASLQHVTHLNDIITNICHRMHVNVFEGNISDAYPPSFLHDFFSPNFYLIKFCDPSLLDSFCEVLPPSNPNWNEWKMIYNSSQPGRPFALRDDLL